MVINLSEKPSLVSNWVSELRDVHIQKDRMRFRRNLERIGEVAAFEISKQLESSIVDVQTPLGIHKSKLLKEQPVVATILRAGIPMHHGMVNYFDKADCAFLCAYRKHHDDGSFEIKLEYMSCPNLANRDIIICDPMLATGASLVKCIDFLKTAGQFKSLNIVCAIASKLGIETIKIAFPDATIWCGDIDETLSDKGYIVPGLGDAGDLSFGEKIQH
jgi:uracil phosphoribosyltransferase